MENANQADLQAALQKNPELQSTLQRLGLKLQSVDLARSEEREQVTQTLNKMLGRIVSLETENEALKAKLKEAAKA
jgi:hypothetical protein